MKGFKRLFFLGLLFQAQSSISYECVGDVEGLGIDPKNGHVLVNSIGEKQWPRLCSVRSELNGVDPETCKTVYSTLLSAQVSSKRVRMWFNDEGNCGGNYHEPWELLSGWYFGPVIE